MDQPSAGPNETQPAVPNDRLGDQDGLAGTPLSTGGWWAAFSAGFRIIMAVPAIILAATGAGFGALAKDAGIGIGHTAFMSVVVYATPAQVVLADQLARGAPLIAVAFAVMLTGIRFLPMTVTLMPYLRGPGTRAWQFYLASHFVAITGWSEAVRRLPEQQPAARMPYFLGLGSALMSALLLGTVVGYLVAGTVPPLLTSALLFMTPIYFLLSQILNLREPIDGFALGIGLVLGPVFLLLAPGFDLLLSGLVGGTLAFVIARRAGGSSLRS